MSTKNQQNSLNSNFSSIQNPSKTINCTSSTISIKLIPPNSNLEIPSTSYTMNPQIKQSDKWKNPKYSRSKRGKSLLEDGDGQLLITNFYQFLNSITEFVENNKLVSDLIISQPNVELTDIEMMITTSPSSFLNALCQASLSN